MVRILITVLALVFLGISESKAQMAAAQPTQWNLEQSVVVPVSRDSVWTLLKDYSLVSKLSNGFVQSIVHKDDIMPILRETTFADGTKREELLSQLEEQHRFLVFKIKDSSLPMGIQEANIAVFTSEKGDKETEILWRGIVKGTKKEKADYLEVLKVEIAQYEKGFMNYLNSKPQSIPAVRMKE